jgi:HSP20 family molecular chaperone IbpA
MADVEKATGSTPAIERRRPDWFEQMLADWPRLRLLPMMPPSFEDEELIRVEQSTSDKEVVVRAEAPGIDPEKDVEITVSDHTLRMRVERREESESEEEGVKRSEFRYGSFSRTVPLPVGAVEKDVGATYKDGILEVRIPLDQRAAESKKIKVKRH